MGGEIPGVAALIARAPVRISFGGGGTDLPAYYTRFGGMVVSTTINHYVYTILSPGTRNTLQIISADYQVFFRQSLPADLFWDGDLALPKAVVHHFGNAEGLNIFLASQIPPGTGLGSSGSVAVSMITALAAWYGWEMSRSEIAELACTIEIEQMGMPVGKQDQYAAAFGGLNEIRFEADGVTVRPVEMPPGMREALQNRLLLFFTGSSRKSSSILKHQSRASAEMDPQVVSRMHAIKELGEAILASLRAGNLNDFGELLHLSWLNKRQVAPGVTNRRIDAIYEAARQAGAVGGKITGAGGGGFLMLYVPEERQAAVTETLQGMGLRRMDFAFDTEGAQVILPVHHREGVRV